MNLVLNSTNVVAGSNNTRYQYKFIAPVEIKENATLSVSNITIPYSWFNISDVNNNNFFQFYFPDSTSTGTGYIIPLKDGWYSVSDLNAILQQFCIANSLYLIDGWGNYVYYLTITYDSILYAVRTTAKFVPTSLPSGWTQPAGWHGYNATLLTPILQVSTTGFGNLIGFNTGLYPTSNTSETSFLSTKTPQGSVVNNIIVRSNLIDNDSGFPTDILDTIPIDVPFGTNLNYSPKELKVVKCIAGTIQSFEVFFSDQNLNPMFILDNNVCISLLLKN